ncbi:uncharacterized protein LOC130713972 [Lotus japonicus]|uniref:uncharacterized protein LOC130713972 n=1 Tax=Lotus japonicus TaxID=34305 RepID=UPI00258E9C21|nr:uncharacterized protein LOC130713972 [Lotus japonicus]
MQLLLSCTVAMDGACVPLPSPSSFATPSKCFPLPSSLVNHNRDFFLAKPQNKTLFTRCSVASSAVAVDRDEASGLGKPDTAGLPKVDKTGRFCSPRAARELALSIIYASCLEGLDPVRLFEKRLNERREAGYQFDQRKLLEYNPMSFAGPPVTVQSEEEANELLRNIEKESDLEAEILSAPPKLVYNKLILRFTRKLLVAVRDSWDSHVLVINKVVPPTWKDEPAGKILELSILHLAMSEMTKLETIHQIVINEAVDLAKRYCDGASSRIINGCLRTFYRDTEKASDR